MRPVFVGAHGSLKSRDARAHAALDACMQTCTVCAQACVFKLEALWLARRRIRAFGTLVYLVGGGGV